MTDTINLHDVHPFERAQLGKAPFKFAGMHESVYQACPGAPIQPGSSCDYCGQGIRYVFRVRGACGREFKVGIDCINRLHAKSNKVSGATRLQIDAARAAKEFRRQQRDAKVAARVAATQALLAGNPALLADQPSPFPHRAAKGETMRNHIEWLLKHGGNQGRTKACIFIERAAKAAGNGGAP